MSWVRRAQNLLNPEYDPEAEHESSNNSEDAEEPFEDAPDRVPPVVMANYDETTGEDGDGALEKACHSLKGYEWDPNDLDFYFNQVELKMRQAGVKKSYTKLLVLTSILPQQIRDQVKPILRKRNLVNKSLTKSSRTRS